MAKIYLTEETLNKVLDEKLAPIQTKLNSLEKKVNALSVKDNGVKETKATTTTRSTKTTRSAKSAKATATATTDTVQRRRISTTKRLEGDAFSKVYTLVKKYNGRIVHKDENGKALPKDRAHWTFSLNDGKAFADEVDKTKVAIFGKGTKTVPMKSATYTVAR